MKTISKVFVLMITVFVVSACGNNEESNDNESTIVVSENLTKADYAIEGMVCAMGCAATIQKDIVELEGVVVSSVNYETGKAHFEFDANVVSEEDIIFKIESIADGQYKVGEWSEDLDENETIEDNESGETGETGETVTEVSLPSFEIPNLFTLLMDQI